MSVCYSLKPTFAFCGEGSEFLYRAHMFLIFPYTFMRHFYIFWRKKNLRERRKKDEDKRDKKKECIPHRDVRSESWLVSQPAGLVGLISKTSQSLPHSVPRFLAHTPFATENLCLSHTRGENVSHSHKHRRTHAGSLQNRPHT